MKEPRTFQIVLLAVFGLLALAGLLIFANSGGFGPSKPSIGPVLIWGTLPQEAVEAGIAELTAGSDEYDEVIYEEKSEAAWRTALSDALAAGNGPDLVIISQEDLLSQKSKLRIIPFETIPERTYVDTFVPVFDLFLGDKGTYGIPLAVDPLVLYYNRTMLASEGIASAPKTWEAVAGMAPTLSRRDNASAVQRSAIAIGEYDNVRNARAILSLMFLQAGTPITSSDEFGTVESSLQTRGIEGSFGVSAAESAVDFFMQFGDPAKTVYSWNRSLPDSRDAFLAGDVAFYPGFASELPYLQSANPNLDFDMATIPQPATASSRTTYARGYALVMPRMTENTYGATMTALALSEAIPSTVIADSLSIAPARRALLSPKDNDRFASIYFPEALSAKGWLSPSPLATDAIFSAMVGNISSGRQTSGTALTAASNALDAALR